MLICCGKSDFVVHTVELCRMQNSYRLELKSAGDWDAHYINGFDHDSAAALRGELRGAINDRGGLYFYPHSFGTNMPG